MSSWKWFGVKTALRTRAVGRPKVSHRRYDPKATLVEECVVIIRARNSEEAATKAKAEARRYAALGVTNPHGQKLSWRCLLPQQFQSRRG